MPEEQKNPPKKTSGSNVVVIVVIILGVLLVLGAGGYLAWRFIFQTKIKSLANVTRTNSPSPSTALNPSPSSSITVAPTITPVPALKSGTPANGYVLSDSNTRVINETEIMGFTPWQLKVARNEIYARHGRPFVHKDLQCYFATQNWYTVDYGFNESILSVVENKNIATIKAYEDITNSPLASHDSGCN